MGKGTVDAQIEGIVAAVTGDSKIIYSQGNPNNFSVILPPKKEEKEEEKVAKKNKIEENVKDNKPENNKLNKIIK
jgi:hypothetical protein